MDTTKNRTTPASPSRRALITGAAGDIGRATARRLADGGFKIFLTDRDEEGLKRAASELHGHGHEAEIFACDQSSPAAVASMFEAIDARGGLSAAFVNAGYGRYGQLIDLPFDLWKRHVDVNLNGGFLMTQGSARSIAGAGGGGSIVVNASTAAAHVCDLLGAYAASKAALAMMARTFASELGPQRIRVNLILPGVIETRMTESLLNDQATRTDLLANTPVGRLGKPEDVADLVHFLCSDVAAFITGAEILIDGGQTIHGYPRWFSTDYSAAEGWHPHSERR